MSHCRIAYQIISGKPYARKPIRPQTRISNIGLFLNLYEAINTPAKIMMLSTNRNVDSVGEPKFSADTNLSAEAAISPTTVLRRMEKMFAKVGLSLCFISTLVTISINKKGSKITENDARNAPNTPIYAG